MWTVAGLIVGQNYKYHGEAGCILYKTGDLFEPTIVAELTEKENIFVAAVKRVEYDYFAIKILAGEKMGWMFVQETDELFQLLIEDETAENTK